MCWCACSTTGIWSRVLDNEKRWVEVTDHGNELPEENAGCHKARQDKKWRNQKKSKPTVVEVIRRRRLTLFGHVSRMSGDRLPTRALHCYIPGKRSRGRPCKKWINNKRTWIVYNWTWRKRWTSHVTDKNGDIVFQPHRHHWVDGRARRRRLHYVHDAQ